MAASELGAGDAKPLQWRPRLPCREGELQALPRATIEMSYWRCHLPLSCNNVMLQPRSESYWALLIPVLDLTFLAMRLDGT
jgi:hypothetical protein